MKDSIREMMVRLYDSRVIDRLDDLWKKHERLYTTKNAFICDLLLRGIESVENEMSNVKEMQRDGNIFKEMKRLTSLLDRFVDVGYEHYKESYVIGKENQTLISRLMMLFSEWQKNTVYQLITTMMELTMRCLTDLKMSPMH